MKIRKIKNSVIAIIVILCLMFSTSTSFASLTSKAVGDYDFSESETNNKISTADRIYSDYTVTGYLGKYDLDYFKFTLDKSCKIEIVAVAGARTTYVSLRNSSDSAIINKKMSYYDGSYSAVISTTLSAGTYYIMLIDENEYNTRNVYAFHYLATPLTSSHTHNYSYSSEVTKEATCTSSGTKVNYCSCGEYQIESIQSTGHSYDSWIIDKAATCTEAGEKSRKCSVCGIVDSKIITATGHQWGEWSITSDTDKCGENVTVERYCSNCNIGETNNKVKEHTWSSEYILETKASFEGDGSQYKYCKICNTIDYDSIVKIPKVKSVTLSNTVYKYDGKVKTPTVKVKDSTGKILVKGTDYTVSYAKGRKNVGKYNIKITLKGKYEGSVTKAIKIYPPRTYIKSLKSGNNRFTAYWAKKTTQVDGYQIKYSRNKSFKKGTCKYITIKKDTITAKTFKNLKDKKRYYVTVRTYKKVNGLTYYSGWSNWKSVKTK